MKHEKTAGAAASVGQSCFTPVHAQHGRPDSRHRGQGRDGTAGEDTAPGPKAQHNTDPEQGTARHHGNGGPGRAPRRPSTTRNQTPG
eukprot:6981693-Pyramimonas_sp.AAC.1